MPYSSLQSAHNHVERLMDIATTLTDYTASSAQADQIPAYLCRMLHLEPITLAVVRHEPRSTAPRMALLSTSSPLTAPGGVFIGNILELTRPFAGAPAHMLRSPFSDTAADGFNERGFSEFAVEDVPGYPRALAFVRPIDETHRLCLIVHQRSSSSPPTLAQIDSLNLVLRLLTKLFRCMLAWQDRPELLGASFGRLTPREWTVLQGLNSDDGEKQLADRLSLSPHTLHSHIKSIYRKMGVQGRLPLLLQLNGAIRELRRNAISNVVTETPPQLAAACG